MIIFFLFYFILLIDIQKIFCSHHKPHFEEFSAFGAFYKFRIFHCSFRFQKSGLRVFVLGVLHLLHYMKRRRLLQIKEPRTRKKCSSLPTTCYVVPALCICTPLVFANVHRCAYGRVRSRIWPMGFSVLACLILA